MEFGKLLKNILKPNEKVAFLIGAGISIEQPTGFPSGYQFSDNILKRIANEKGDSINVLRELADADRPDRNNINDFIRFEELMSVLQEECDPSLEILDILESARKPNAYHFVLACLSKLGHIIITTNFDSQIEKAAVDIGMPFEQIIWDDEFQISKKKQGKVYKIHGSLKKYKNNKWEDSKESIQATLSAVGKPSELTLEENKSLFFSYVLKNHHLIVLGYSGYDDFDISPMLIRTESKKDIIWINHNLVESSYLNGLQILNKEPTSVYSNKTVELLSEISLFSRKKENVHLFNTDTSLIRKELIKYFDIRSTKKSAYTTPINFSKFFDKWEEKHLRKKGKRELIIGHLMYNHRRLDSAASNYKKSYLRFSEINEYKQAAVAAYNVALVNKEQGKYESFLKYIDLSLDFAKSTENYSILTKVDMSLGGYNLKQGLLDASRNHYRSAHKSNKNITNINERLDNLSNICSEYSVISLHNGAFKKAIAYAKTSLNISENLGNKLDCAKSFLNLSAIHMQTKKLEEALLCNNMSASLAEKIGDDALMASAKHNSGCILFYQKKYEESLQIFKESIAIKERIKHPDINTTHHQIGLCEQVLKRYEASIKSYNKSLIFSSKKLDNISFGATIIQIGTVYKEMEEYEKSMRLFMYAKNILKDSDSVYIDTLEKNIKSIQREVVELNVDDVVSSKIPKANFDEYLCILSH